MSAPSLATRLVDLVLESEARLFHTSKGDGYITIDVDGHLEHHHLASRGTRDFIARLAYQTTQTAAPAQAIADALSALGGMAVHDGPEHEVFVRVAGHGDAIYLDLCDPEWRTVAVTPSGWTVEATCPIRFRRTRGALPLGEPRRGGHVDALRELIHVDEDHDFYLLIGFVLGALSPGGPFPLLGLTGEQGSGKSTTARMLRRLIDPAVAELRAEPKREEDVLIAASTGHIIAFDNLSYLSPWLSDCLCRIATGGAISKRQLFTDGDEFSIEAKRPALVTSVTPVVSRGDLLDRMVGVDLPVMAERDRRRESDLWRRFDAVAPAVLGAILDGAVSGLRQADEPPPANLPRMADWGSWVFRCAPGLGWPEATIVDAHGVSRSQAVAEAVAGDPVAVALRTVQLPWTGTAAALLDRITPSGRTPKGWPETPRGMSAALRRLAPMLRQTGIEITLGMRHGHLRDRLVRVEATECPTEDPPEQPSAPSASSAGRKTLAQSADGCADDCADDCQPSAEPSAGLPPKTLAPDGADGADDLSGASSVGEVGGDEDGNGFAL